MPSAFATALLVLYLLAQPGVPPRNETARQKSIEIGFIDAFDRSSFQFSLSEQAYVAVFEVGRNRVQLVYPAIGPELRKLRFGESSTLPAPDNQFDAGKHPLPPRAGRGWSASTRNGVLMKGDHILIVASKRPFRFERLNDLYEGEGETFRLHNSLGVVDDMPDLLARTVLPDHTADDWSAYLHWIRPRS